MTDPELIADRRRIRRKLSFWRILTVLIFVGLIIAVWLQFADQSKTENHIARITIDGVITDNKKLIDLINEVAKNNAAKALIVRISSPGGTTYGGEQIYKALLRVGKSKPVVADVRTMAASAGYMIAAASDHIVAGESSIVGSIGVVFQYPQAAELLKKIGVRMDEIKSSPLKAEPSPFHDASDAAKAMIRSMVLDSYDWFVDLVAKRRKMDRAKVLRLADGSVFTGRQGLANGLVDELGGEAEIRAYLKSRNIDDRLEIVDWQPQTDQMDFLFNRSSTNAVLKILGYPISISQEINHLTGGKLFLDGLLSVWQVGNQEKLNK